MLSSVVVHRRALHRIPELSDQLPETTAYVQSVLASLRCVVTTPIPGGICAWFDAGKAETVAFRADMDALPETENTGLPYASTHPGKMHACGHDGHTAMALALAEHVSAHLEELPRNVLFLFQPAEETFGGAKHLCETGVLEARHVVRVFGLHLWPKLEAGRVFTRPGPLMARANELKIIITGHSVHISRAHEGRDALAAGVDFYQRSAALAASVPPPRVLGYGKLVSGTVRNAVSGETVLEGTLRTYHEETYRACREGLERIAREVAAESRCAVDLQISDGYPPVWNHEELYHFLCRQLGPDAPALLAEPVLAAEDFSFYQQRVPGVFCFLGVGDTAELHAPEFCFDDETILPQGVEFLKRLLMLP